MIRKHSAKVLTLRNVIRFMSNKEETLSFVLVGGRWRYNGTTAITTSLSERDGFWRHDIKHILDGGPAYSLGEIKKFFYEGPNKSMQIATREWTTNQEVYGVPF